MKHHVTILLLIPSLAIAQRFVDTYAGTGVSGLTNGNRADATFFHPFGMAMGADGTVYVADADNNVIRKISNGVVSTLAGTGIAGLHDGAAAEARFTQPSDLCADENGNVYVSDFANQCIRKISTDGIVTTIAGTGTPGYTDGPGAAAQFDYPRGIARNRNGDLFVSDSWNHRIRRIATDGTVSTYAGGGTSIGLQSAGNWRDGPDTTARFWTPSGVGIDTAGNVYVADAYNHRIRMITPDRMVTTIAGSGAIGPNNGGYLDGSGAAAVLNTPTEVFAMGVRDVYFSDTFGDRVRRISGGIVHTIAGSGSAGARNGIDTAAQFDYPRGIVARGAVVLVSDYHNNCIRMIAPPADSWDGVAAPPTMPQLSLYPNPSSGVVTIAGVTPGVMIHVYGSNGAVLDHAVRRSGNDRFDISTLPIGSYFIRIDRRIARLSLIRGM